MFTKAMSGVLSVCNILLFLLLLYHIGIGGLSHPPVSWEYKDLITIILTALAVSTRCHHDPHWLDYDLGIQFNSPSGGRCRRNKSR